MSRPRRKVIGHLTAEEAWSKTITVGKNLTRDCSLGLADTSRVKAALAILTGPRHQAPRRKMYRRFLYNILQKCGPHTVLVFAIAISQCRLVHMKIEDRDNLLRNLVDGKDCQSLNHQNIHFLARSNKVPKSTKDLETILDELSQPLKSTTPTLFESQENTGSESDTRAVFPNTEQSELGSTPVTLSKDPIIFENPFFKKIVEIFEGYICDTIRRITIEGEVKAGITMVFPGWGDPVACLMSLDIYEENVAQLAMDLFKAEVKWAGHILHVTLENGITLTTETSEVTLKGVGDEAISKVFGSKIHDAINECPIRAREAKPITECVSMILTKTGAFISLSLGAKAGGRVQETLYSY